MNWKLPDWKALERRQLYLISGVAVPILAVMALLVLWAAGGFGGGSDEEAVDCTPCPSGTATRTPRPSPSGSTTGTPTACCTPTLDPTLAPTEAPTEPPTQAPTPTQPPGPATYGLTPYLSAPEFNRIVDFAIIPGTNNTEAIVLTQKDARILRVSLTGAFAPQVFGDLSGFVGGGGNEEGLLSAAFSPDFQNDGRIYVYYTQGGSSGLPTVLSRFQVSGGSMDTTNETRILEVPDFASNHNGGRLLFGPDGYLYLSTGDGGAAGDPLENGQALTTLLGKVLRLAVSGENTYSVPPDNPFADGPGGNADEIWAYGLRNPWRYSFDRASGALWLGDVGQGSWEEVDLVVRAGNYGWDCYEGFAEFVLTDNCPPQSALQFPRAAYPTHEGGSCAVTGGYVYRGSAMPELNGRYIFADYCSGMIWALDSGNPSAQPVLIFDSDQQVSSFYELPDGELLVLTFSTTIYRLARG